MVGRLRDPLRTFAASCAVLPQLLAVMLVAILLTGCSQSLTGVHLVNANQQLERLEPGSPLLPTGKAEYRIAPLDTLQVDVFPVPGRTTRIDYGSQVRITLVFAGGAYVISPGDVLAVQTNVLETQNAQIVVRPDGRVTLPLLGRDVQAAGLTPTALTAVLTRAYGTVLKAPSVTVSVLKSETDDLSQITGSYQVGPGGEINIPVLGTIRALGLTPADLARQVETVAGRRFRNRMSASASLVQLSGREVDPRLDPVGQTFFRNSVKVSPEGEIRIQPGPVVKVVDQSLSEARATVVAALGAFYANPIDVSVSLVDAASMSISVAGEVRAPGRYPYTGATSLLRVLTQSGWTTEFGNLKDVLLLHPTAPGKYNVYHVNLTEVIEKGISGQDLPVGPRDIVLVPMTGIGKANRFVDQYIRRMLPFVATASLSYITPNNINRAATTVVP